MFGYIAKILTPFENADPKATGMKTSAAPNNHFKVDKYSTKLKAQKAEAFHTIMAKALYVTKRARPDTCTLIAFLATGVREPHVDDCATLTHLIKYIRGTKELPLILSANGSGVVKWWVGGLFAIHLNMRGHTGTRLSLGWGFPITTSTKQKLNTRSSTESEIFSVDNLMPAICWTQFFL